MSEDSKISNLVSSIKGLEGRLGWDEYFMTIAYLISKRSSCDRLNVGCVITRDNMIISTGYNGHIAGTPHNSLVVNNHEQLTIHAEVNAVCHSSKNGVSLKNSKAYVTHHPCVNCTKTLIAAGVVEIVYSEDYKTDPIAIKLLLSAGVKVNKMDICIETSD